VGLQGFGDRYPHQLSGGMRKRVALAQTLILDPDIILMDEPFSALDIQTRQLMENEVLDLWNAKKKAVLFITHDLDEAIAMSDRVIVLAAGPGTHPSANSGSTCRARAMWPRSACIRVSSNCTSRSGMCCAMKCSRATNNRSVRRKHGHRHNQQAKEQHHVEITETQSQEHPILATDGVANRAAGLACGHAQPADRLLLRRAAQGGAAHLGMVHGGQR
jgi:ABC-type sulfate/molybdate transport systems ATPase subunit